MYLLNRVSESTETSEFCLVSPYYTRIIPITVKYSQNSCGTHVYALMEKCEKCKICEVCEGCEVCEVCEVCQVCQVCEGCEGCEVCQVPQKTPPWHHMLNINILLFSSCEGCQVCQVWIMEICIIIEMILIA